jgi:hypothetical protein
MSDENQFLAICFLVPILATAGLLRASRLKGATKGVAAFVKMAVANLLFLILFVGTACLAGEIYYRFVCDETDAFGFSKISQRWHDRHWHDNGWHWRDNVEYSTNIAHPHRRITFVGDSFTAGYGIKNVEDRFVNRIRRDCPDWEVHMLAHPGFETGDEIKTIKAAISKGYELDRVVLVYCLNDISDIMPGWKKSVDQMVTNKLRQNWWTDNSYFLNSIYTRVVLRRDPNLRGYCDFVSRGYEGAEWEQQKARLTEFVNAVRAHNGKIYVVTFPFLHALGPRYPFEFVHRNLETFWHSLSVPHLDLLTVYSNTPPRRLMVNRFDAHPNEYADKIAAQAIEKFLSP